ncbi:MAG: hypothetical protein R3321_11980, partial [Nitrososphaeraceae archaeon]|nr:hypothetical protein [Nitrososphaeraceae archaeon]
ILSVVLSLLSSLLIGINHPALILIVVIFIASSVLYFIPYFIFFKKANQEFANLPMSKWDLEIKLNTWERWHWARIIFEVIALLCAMSLLILIVT